MHRRTSRLVVIVTALMLLAAACGGGESYGGDGIELTDAEAGAALRDPARTTTTVPPELADQIATQTTVAGGDNPDAQAQATTTTAPQIVVMIHDDEDAFYFEPRTVRVQAGGTVTWKNATTRDKVRQIVSDDRSTFVSPELAPGQEWSWTFTSPGFYTYGDFSRPYTEGSGTVEVV